LLIIEVYTIYPIDWLTLFYKFSKELKKIVEPQIIIG